MPQPHSFKVSSIVTHLICSDCLNPMHINVVEITDVGGEKIQFVCDVCGAATIREYARRRRVMTAVHLKQ